nr:ribosomal protein S8 [Bolbitis deltigera]WCO87006.1 ribosomal protein S8 [Bolbitis deltigera]
MAKKSLIEKEKKKKIGGEIWRHPPIFEKAN